jgi:acetyltransferase-like isoleucine patch superfamily enzyme
MRVKPLHNLFPRVLFRIRHLNFASRIRSWLVVFSGASIGHKTFLPRLHITWPHQIQIGSRCSLEPDVCFKFDGIWSPGPSIIIGDGVFIGRSCEFNIRKHISIGDRCAIASGCRFIDHDHGITGTQIDETPGIELPISIGESVWIGCNVVVLKGVTIGSSAVVAAGAVVTKSIPAGEIWGGVPAQKISSRSDRQAMKSIHP